MEKKLDKELYPDYVYPEHKGGDEGPPPLCSGYT